ncbi:nitrogen regulation protein NR(I) [Devosia neptuniae]|jgi:two-component system nitrogen regulation response regulator GlnG|uniref:DNA-binding transcriptional regulator NtrC n=1 Tax=Devosia neptuniae TaxID=191302 RepID=A0ABY6CB16_9HYPH|nr:MULTISPECIES: nitrogen regulation protein NR(I) [Devosia]KFC72399.1 Nitrogen assimilation regulatory protein [Devosia sp. LC5]UXN69325.1 nitrogen regulation protein NR(I) [Devosia neptuniae]
MSHVVLLADDDAAIRMVLNQALTRAGYEVRPTGNISTMWNWVSRGEGDILITDVAMPDGNAFEVMPKIKKLRPDLPMIVMSAQNTFMTAIRASEVGAYEYLPKPFDITEVLSVVARALADAKKPTTAERKAEEPGETMPLVGRSTAMQDIYRALARLMQTDLTVMITGESGTGKELVARALHDFGKRRNGPFVAINMAAIPRDLIEAELFGHEKGAFTGANTRSSGRFEQAEGGTLFLDEIGDMPMDAQTRLLRVLQEGEYTMVGGRSSIKTNVRIVAATHRDLSQMIRQGLFREDLYYRLNVVPIRLPPLRERIDDIGDLTTHFLNAAQREGEAVKSIAPEAIRLMQNYSWPGNVRELENLVRRLSALYADESISAEIVQNELNIAERPQTNGMAGPVDVSMAVETHVGQLLREYEPNLPPAGLYQRVIDRVEAPLIAMALNACGGNQIKAADLLGLNRNTLRKKIRTHSIEIVKHSRRN